MTVILDFYAPEIEDGGTYCFNLANNFWTVSAIALIFHMNIPCDRTIIFHPVTLEFDQIKKKPFNLAYIFWTVSARALLYHMSISSEDTFP